MFMFSSVLLFNLKRKKMLLLFPGRVAECPSVWTSAVDSVYCACLS